MQGKLLVLCVCLDDMRAGISVRTSETSGDLREIDAAFFTEQEAFARQGYVVLPALVEPPLTDFFWSYVHTKFASLLLTTDDRQVPNTPSE